MTSPISHTETAVQQYGRMSSAQIDTGDDVFGRDHTSTWGDAIDGWTVSAKANKSPTTIRQRRWQLRTLAEMYHNRSPWKITLEDLEAWLIAHEWSAESRKSARSAARSFYSWAVKVKRTKRNPADGLDKIPVARRLPRPASDDILAVALENADDRLTLMLLLAAQGGLRVHEIAKLRWSDIIDDQWLLIRGKKDRERRVPIAERLRTALIAERGRRHTGHVGSGFRYGVGEPDTYVFPGKRGSMNPAWVSELISVALGPGVTAHQLRHRAATQALEGTGNLAAVQDFLGHADPETTRIYSPVSDRALKAIADVL